MEKSYSASYAAAGVDITAGYRSVELMKQYVARTMTENCIGGLGGFGGLFELDCSGMEHPVLISGTDGVGTKLRSAEVLLKPDGSFQKIRRAETPADYFATFDFTPFFKK